MLISARWFTGVLLGAAIIAFAFTLGRVTGHSGAAAVPAQPSAASAQGSVDFGVLNQIYSVLKSNYVEPDRVDPQTLYEAAINGLLGPVKDTGTFYVDPTTWQTQVGVSGTFTGVGATVSQQGDKIVVTAPIKGTPAERAGVRAGDVILEVNGESTQGWTVD